MRQLVFNTIENLLRPQTKPKYSVNLWIMMNDFNSFPSEGKSWFFWVPDQKQGKHKSLPMQFTLTQISVSIADCYYRAERSSPSFCMSTWIDVLSVWDMEMFEFHSSLRDSVFFWSVFILQALSQQQPFVFRLLLYYSFSWHELYKFSLTHSHTHTPAVPFNPVPPCTHKQSQGHPDVRSKRPHCCHGGSFLPCQHFWGPLRVRQFAPPTSHNPSLFRKKNTIQKARLFYLLFFPLRFIHPQCLAPAVSSPPTLTPTLHAPFF